MIGRFRVVLSFIRLRVEFWFGDLKGGGSIFVLDSNLIDYIIVLGMFVILYNRELLVEKMGF